MIILGINDTRSSACLIKNGKLIALSRGKIARIKNIGGFPSKSKDYSDQTILVKKILILLLF